MRGVIGMAAAGVVGAAAAIYLTGVVGGNGPARAEDAASATEIAGGIVETPACVMTDDEREIIETATAGSVAAMQPATRGISLAAMPFNAPEGEPTSIAAMEPRVRLINLWATWCAPCRAEMPHLEELDAGSGEAFDVLPLNVDAGTLDRPQAMLEEVSPGLPLFHDNSMGVFTAMRQAEIAVGLPVTVLVDAEGCVLASMNGPANWASEDAVQLMDAAVRLGSQ